MRPGFDGYSSQAYRAFWIVFAFPLHLICVPRCDAATVAIDLDRHTEGLQTEVTVLAGLCETDVQGAVVVIGNPSDVVSANVTQVLGMNQRIPSEGVFVEDRDNSQPSLASCDFSSEFIPPSGSLNGTDFVWTNALAIPTQLGADGWLCLFTFDVQLTGTDQTNDQVSFTFRTSLSNPALGIAINGSNFSFGSGGENPQIPVIEARVLVGEPSGIVCPTKTPSPEPTQTETFTKTLTRTLTKTPTASNTPAFSFTRTPTPTSTSSRTQTPTPTRTRTRTPSRTPTLSRTPTETRTPTVTPTPTETLAPCADSGYYLLSAFGDHFRVGFPPSVKGNLFTPGQKNFLDMEPAADLGGRVDLAMLDLYGVATWVGESASTPVQDFLFPPGRAVDIEVSPSGQGLWVLTDFGGIFRGGDVKPPGEPSLVPNSDQTGVLGYDVPFGDMRNQSAPNPGGASLRAVALTVVMNGQSVSNTLGYLILDSQGGHYAFLPDGQPATPNFTAGAHPHDPARLLDPGGSGYSWPFFPGWDIARDMELMPVTGNGLAVFDGWGGVHPVPVNDRTNAIFYLRNEDPSHPGTPLTTVGMPYLLTGFDDPETVEDEANGNLVGFDVASIFVDLEFCRTGDGFYALDRFGGVFAFGSARAAPNSTSPKFAGGPYFYPFEWMQDIEPMEGETMFGN